MSDACRLLLLLGKDGEGTRKAKKDGSTRRRTRSGRKPGDRVETWPRAGISMGGLCCLRGGKGRKGE